MDKNKKPVKNIRERNYWIHSYISNRKEMSDFYTVFNDLWEHEDVFHVFSNVNKIFWQITRNNEKYIATSEYVYKRLHRTYANVSCNSKVSEYIIKNNNI